MGSSVDVEASGLLDGLEGQARTERAELVDWLLGQGFARRADPGRRLAPCSCRRVASSAMTVGDVSAHTICNETGIDLELLQAIQRALGMPRADDPDAAILLRADSRSRGSRQDLHRFGP